MISEIRTLFSGPPLLPVDEPPSPPVFAEDGDVGRPRIWFLYHAGVVSEMWKFGDEQVTRLLRLSGRVGSGASERSRVLDRADQDVQGPVPNGEWCGWS